MSRIVLAGGSGLIGQALVPVLEKAGHEVLVLSRTPGSKKEVWDARSLGPWAKALDGAHAVINLAGASIAQKWTLQAQQEIRESRVESTLILGEAIARCSQPPQFWINSSAVGFYGNRGEEELDETSESGSEGDFLVDVCKEWEAAARTTCRPETQLRILRLGPVMAAGDGMLPALKSLAKSFLGGPAGNGQQWVSWIHISDVLNMIVWCLADDRPVLVNATSPHPVRNSDLMFAIRHAVRRPWAPPAPAFLIQASAIFGGPDPALILDSARVMPRAAQDAGFEFSVTDIAQAVE